MLDSDSHASQNANPMAAHSVLALYDALHDGAMSRALAQWRAEGVSVVEATWKLRTEFRVSVSPSTVRRWMDNLDGDAA